jgi:hypothetical protein
LGRIRWGFLWGGLGGASFGEDLGGASFGENLGGATYFKKIIFNSVKNFCQNLFNLMLLRSKKIPNYCKFERSK